jgi:spore coat polysaccharide biosynthesis protein SpsF
MAHSVTHPQTICPEIEVLAILQARFGSTRLPGKVLRPILGKPMLGRQLERVAHASTVDKLIVATTLDASDNAIQELCATAGITCFRGDRDDLLDRFYQASKPFKPKHVVRLTGDCPLLDSTLIDGVVQFYLDGSYDYASNAIRPTFPDGLDVEVFGFRALVEAWSEAKLPSQREHVTSFIYSQPERYRIGHFMSDNDLAHLRWTVDEVEDFDLVHRIYEDLYPKNPNFKTSDILQLIENHPELKTLNKHFRRNEGYESSLRKDQQLIRKTGFS